MFFLTIIIYNSPNFVYIMENFILISSLTYIVINTYNIYKYYVFKVLPLIILNLSKGVNKMRDTFLKIFQDTVDKSLFRHKSLIDIITKTSESSARLNRAIAKSITECGCINLSAKKQAIPFETSFENISDFVTYQVSGNLCEHCLEVLEDEIGNHMFYIASICNALNVDLTSALSEELNKITTLGKYGML